MAKLSPSAGGCWFCHTDDEKYDWNFSFEVDAWFHRSCLMEALNDKSDLEAKAIKEELDCEGK